MKTVDSLKELKNIGSDNLKEVKTIDSLKEVKTISPVRICMLVNRCSIAISVDPLEKYIF